MKAMMMSVVLAMVFAFAATGAFANEPTTAAPTTPEANTQTTAPDTGAPIEAAPSVNMNRKNAKQLCKGKQGKDFRECVKTKMGNS